MEKATLSEDSRNIEIHDLPHLAHLAMGRKPAWSHQSEDLSLNLISCTAGQGIARHVNPEVDVLVIGIDGAGTVEIDENQLAMRPGQVIVIPKGTQRALHCVGDHFAYLTCHRRRKGLWPTVQTDDTQSSSGELS